MKACIKIMRPLLDTVRADLERSHPFAAERVGFLLAGATYAKGQVILTVNSYQGVDDEDYEQNSYVGAEIGSNAMRKAVQAAYRPQQALLHIHSHGGYGQPEFSDTDISSACDFVPAFFHPVPKMPHGLLVLSDDSVSGIFWQQGDQDPIIISDFITVGSPYARNWRPI